MNVPENLREATQYWAGHTYVLLALDFDGTLASFQADPMDSRTEPVADAALRRLAGDPKLRLALVSGRPIADLVKLAQPSAGTYLVGSHGGQRGYMGKEGFESLPSDEPGDAALRTLAAVRTDIEAIVATHPGTWIEIKPFAMVLHTRSAEPDVSHDATSLAIAGPGNRLGVYLLRGKEVVEISVVRTTKGDALTWLVTRAKSWAKSESFGTSFVGDDVTDEDAFAIVEAPPRGLAIKVGPGRTTAPFRVNDPEAVGRWLTVLADLRGVGGRHA